MSDQPMVNLNVSDISDAVKVIDYACDQGAYRGWDNIRQVQAVRDRLDAFVVAATAITGGVAENTETVTDNSAVEPVETADSLPVNNPRRQRRPRVAR